VLLWQKVKGAVEVEVMAPVTVESMTETAAPEDTLIAPFWLAFFRHVVVPGELRVRVPVCGPEMVEVQAPVAGTSPPAPWTVSEPAPHAAATARPPIRVANMARRRLVVITGTPQATV
jgi:hypothetical protein